MIYIIYKRIVNHDPFSVTAAAEAATVE